VRHFCRKLFGLVCLAADAASAPDSTQQNNENKVTQLLTFFPKVGFHLDV